VYKGRRLRLFEREREALLRKKKKGKLLAEFRNSEIASELEAKP